MIDSLTGSPLTRHAFGIVTAIALATQPSLATAGTISYGASLSGGEMSLALFDPGLGKLESATLELKFSAFGFLATSVPISTFTVNVLFSSPLLGPDPLLAETKSTDVSCNPICAATISLSNTKAFSYVDADILDDFTSVGSFKIFGIADSNFSSLSTTVDLSASATITYEYVELGPQTVPEPASLSLVGLALLGCMRKREPTRKTATACA